MKRLPLVALAALMLVLFAGCSHIPFFSRFAKKSQSHAPKESSRIATDAEQEFKQRWVERRAAELVSQGKAPADARAQGSAEFDQRFSATHVAHE